MNRGERPTRPWNRMLPRMTTRMARMRTVAAPVSPVQKKEKGSNLSL